MQTLPRRYLTGGLLSAALLLATTSSAALALDDVSQCVELSDRQPVEMELSIADDYANCFTLAGVPLDSDVTITSMTEANFTHQIKVYEVQHQRGDLIASYDSNARGLTQVSISQNGRPIAIKLSPQERSSNKHLKAQYLQMGSQPQLVLELFNRD